MEISDCRASVVVADATKVRGTQPQEGWTPRGPPLVGIGTSTTGFGAHRYKGGSSTQVKGARLPLVTTMTACSPKTPRNLTSRRISLNI